MKVLSKKWLYSHKLVASITAICISIVVIGGVALAFTRNGSISNSPNKETTTNPSQVNGQSAATGSGTENTSNNSTSTSSNKPNTQSSNSNTGTTPASSSGSGTGSSTGSGGGGTPTPPPQPITGWTVSVSNADQCHSGSEGDKIYCAPGKTGTYYISTNKGTTIKNYTYNSGPEYVPTGVTITINKISASVLRVQVTSSQAQDDFQSPAVYVEVNEYASPQQLTAIKSGVFRFRAFCTTTPPHSGCAP